MTGEAPRVRSGEGMKRPSTVATIITCEHGGRDVPPAYAARFAGHDALLESHRGWDPGALVLGREMSSALGVPLHAATVTRLLIDLNRSIGHRQLFSEITRALVESERAEIVANFYRPHRNEVEGAITSAVHSGTRVVHIASHSFTPNLDGDVRKADVAFLYDPRRHGERAFAARWMGALHAIAPSLRLRRNYPYQGKDDGLTAMMRKRHPDAAYVGIELEVNQRFFAEGGAAWDAVRADVIASLRTALSPLEER